MANKELAYKLKALRMKNQLTQKDVYSQLNISQSTFSSWEVGKSEPDALTFLKLCKIYKVKDILLEFTGESIDDTYNVGHELYDSLDEIDKAEIRGEMKQLLKFDKYKNKSTAKQLENDIASEIAKQIKTVKSSV